MNCDSRTQPMDWGGKIWIVGFMYAKSCPILCNPMAHSPPGSSVHEILQAKILEWVTMLLQGIFLTQGLNPCLFHLLDW